MRKRTKNRQRNSISPEGKPEGSRNAVLETTQHPDFFATDPLHERHRLLAFLLPMLQAKGFQITPDRQIQLQRLLDLLPPDVPGRDLADSLCPIFATDSREQNLFHEEFLKLDFLFVSKEETPAGPSQTPREKPKDPIKPTSENQEKKSPTPEKPTEPSKPKTPEPSKPQTDKPRNPLIPDIEKCTEPPYLWKIAPDENIPLETSAGFGRTLTRLRSRELSENRQIDWSKTLRDTARQPGTLQLRHRRRSRPIEYLMLVERFSADDHRALLFDRLWQMLRDQEVLVERFFHDGDLRSCHNEQFPTGISLRDLSHRFAHSRLLVLGTGHRMLNPVTGQPADWTKTLPDWRLRALLTPISRHAWGLPEKNISDVFPLLPAAWESVEYFSELTGGEEKTRFAELPAYVRDAADWKPIVLEKPLMRSLRQHFDENMCAWIAACALWPSLHFDLTLRLGRLFSTPENNLLTLEKFTRLCRLDWFANGYIPRPERHELLEYLEARFPEKLRAATDVLLNLLEQNLTEIPQNSRARADHQINLAILRLMNTENPDPETVQQLRTVIKRLDRAAEITDFVLPASVDRMMEKLGLDEKSNLSAKGGIGSWAIGVDFVVSPEKPIFQPEQVVAEKYRLEKLVGHGGVADVWKAMDLSKSINYDGKRKFDGGTKYEGGDAFVSLKIYRRHDALGEKLASHEFEISRSLSHPNINPVLDYGMAGEHPFLVFPFYESTAFHKIGKISEEDVWKIMHDIGSALEYLHRLQPQVLHNDLKPEHFMITAEGKYVLGDFGIAQQVGKNGRMSSQNDLDLWEWLRAKTFIPESLPPEMLGQKWNPEVLSEKTDIWMLTSALFRLIEGIYPKVEHWAGGDDAPVFRLNSKRLREKFSSNLAALVERSLEGDTHTRPSASYLVKTSKNHLFEKRSLPKMIPVRGGTFKMGSSKYNDEKPVHEVTLSDFEIGKHPVTQKLWTEIMGSNPSRFKGDSLPVEQVSWDDCRQFLKKLNQKFPGKNYRLPIEAEWEFAARGGTLSKGYEYVGSNYLNEVGWFRENSGSRTHPVGQKKPNELGIHDMSGNVWEWCDDDWHSNYKGAPSDGRAWIDSPRGTGRVRRGGSWNDAPQSCRVANRLYFTPDVRYGSTGFRLARTN